MPSHGLIRQFADLFAVEEDWRWSGSHYQRTALDWLAISMPTARDRPDPARGLWQRRRSMAAALALFFLATAGLFGHDDGNEWGVSHYRLRKL